MLRLNRFGNEEIMSDSRKSVDSNGEMCLLFIQNNLIKLPNKKALQFHKTACLIWRMAGGGEPDEEHCPDNDDFSHIDYVGNKDVQKW
jgi:hypothetical protein